MPRPPGIGSGAWDMLRARVLGAYGTVCWICEHGGARQVDHVEPVTERPDLAFALSNMRPAHGSRNPCPVCSEAAGRKVCCNQLKAGMSIERARRLIEERTGLRIGEPLPRKEPERARADPGREWLPRTVRVSLGYLCVSTIWTPLWLQ